MALLRFQVVEYYRLRMRFCFEVLPLILNWFQNDRLSVIAIALALPLGLRPSRLKLQS
jgi:hypothetical protein